VALTAALDPVRHEAITLGKPNGIMRLGLAISIALHLAILLWAAVSFSSARPPVVPDEVPVEVSLLTTADLANLRKGSDTAKTKTTAAPLKDADPVEAPPVKAKRIATPPPAADPAPPEPKVEVKADPLPSAPKVEPKPAPVPPAPKVEATPDPVPPVIKPDLIAQQLGKAEPFPSPAKTPAVAKPADPIAEVLAKTPVDPPPKKDPPKKVAAKEDPVPPEPVTKPPKKPKAFDISKLQAQIDNLPNAAPEAGSDQTPDVTAKTKAPAVGVAHPTGTQLSVTEQQMYLSIFSHKVQGCWTVLAGAADGRDLVVPVSFDLAPDGSLKSDPVVTSAGPSASFGLAAENVVRAIRQCAPYALPPGDYAKWQHWDIDFDPRAMFGG